jgi:hypothetical protein
MQRCSSPGRPTPRIGAGRGGPPTTRRGPPPPSAYYDSRRDSDRLEASRLLADRGWGKAAAYAAIEEDNPLDLEEVEAAAEEFRRRILRLAEHEPDGS